MGLGGIQGSFVPLGAPDVYVNGRGASVTCSGCRARRLTVRSPMGVLDTCGENGGAPRGFCPHLLRLLHDVAEQGKPLGINLGRIMLMDADHFRLHLEQTALGIKYQGRGCLQWFQPQRTFQSRLASEAKAQSPLPTPPTLTVFQGGSALACDFSHF